jgi:hypothetical protein
MAETIDEVRAMLLAAIDARGIEAIYDPDQLERIRRLRREDKSSYLQVFQKFLRLGGKDDHLKQALANGAATQEAARAPNGPEPKTVPAVVADQSEPGWPKIDPAAYHGLAGDVVMAIEPHTESDLNAILVQFLICFGNAIGRGPYYQMEGDKHATNLFTVLVGDTSKGRKGIAMGRVRQIMRVAEPLWENERIGGGLSSGEGIITAVRDSTGADDPGVADKRLVIFEPEFANVLIVGRREGSTSSRIIREAFDHPNLASMTKTPQRATGALISIIGHVTASELRDQLDRISMANGFANRFLFTCVKRSKLLPFGGDLSDSVVIDLGQRTATALQAAQKISRMFMTEGASKKWAKEYSDLSAGKPGLLGAIIGRGEALTLRLAMLYALLDHQMRIDVEHLQAALALWRYCEASARYVFGDSLGDPVADEIQRALRGAGVTGMTRTEISNHFGRNVEAGRIGRALAILKKCGTARMATRPRTNGFGQPIEIWHAI